MKYLLLSVLVVSLVGILLIPNVFAQTAESEDTDKGQIEELENLESLEALLVELETITPEEIQNVEKHIEKFAHVSALLFEYESLDIEKVRAELLEKINAEDPKKENNLRKEIKAAEKEIKENYVEIRKQWKKIFTDYHNAVKGSLNRAVLSGDNITVLELTKLKSKLPSVESKFDGLEQEKLEKEQVAKRAEIRNEEWKKNAILQSMLERLKIISSSAVSKDIMDKFFEMKSSEKLLKNKIKVLQKELKERGSLEKKLEKLAENEPSEIYRRDKIQGREYKVQKYPKKSEQTAPAAQFVPFPWRLRRLNRFWIFGLFAVQKC